MLVLFEKPDYGRFSIVKSQNTIGLVAAVVIIIVCRSLDRGELRFVHPTLLVLVVHNSDIRFLRNQTISSLENDCRLSSIPSLQNRRAADIELIDSYGGDLCGVQSSESQIRH